MDNLTREELAFDYARDSTKQLMTLATGVLALTVTFASSGQKEGGAFLIASWILLLTSVAFGQWCLMSLTGVLGSQKNTGATPSIYSTGIVFPAVIQIFTFLGGLLATVVYATKALGT